MCLPDITTLYNYLRFTIAPIMFAKRFLKILLLDAPPIKIHGQTHIMRIISNKYDAKFQTLSFSPAY